LPGPSVNGLWEDLNSGKAGAGVSLEGFTDRGEALADSNHKLLETIWSVGCDSLAETVVLGFGSVAMPPQRHV
jgi:hypothetical protein